MHMQVPQQVTSKLWILLLLTGLGLLLLLPGNTGLSIYSGKDEYLLSMRVVLSMHEGNHWWIPMLDGEPRLRKPPGLYWSARAVFELCGPSMFCLRLPAMLWALVWVVSVAGLAGWFYPRQSVAAQLTGGLALMLCAGWLIEGRRLMLDLPVTACASLGFWASIKAIAPNLDAIKSVSIGYGSRSSWMRTLTMIAWWIIAGVFVAYGFLIKGPVVWLIWGTGLLAISFHPQLSLAQVAGFWESPRTKLFSGAFVSFLIAMALAAPWFVDAASQTTLVSEVLDQEVQARLFGEMSLAPLWGFWLISAPWGCYVLVGLWTIRRLDESFRATARSLLIWLLLGLLPFFIMRSFERYLLGALIPVALLLAGMLVQSPLRDSLFRLSPWLRVLSALPMLILFALVSFFLIWFDLDRLIGSLGLIALGVFIMFWWASKSLGLMMAAMACWLLNVLLFISLSYPAIGINQAPDWLIKHAQDSELVFWDGPHPALLAAYSGKAHRHISAKRDGRLDQLKPGQWFVLAQQDRASLEQAAKLRGWELVQVGRWQALVNQGSALRFWPASSDWRLALKTADLSLLQSELVVLRLEKVRW
ncbi:MAG: ArnT family glycosyltransferase [Burkholderiaceae bacterium]